MNKRGLSPLIVTIFLVGMAILVGSIVMMSSFESIGSVQNIADEWAQAEFLKFSAMWPPLADCESLCGDSLNIKCYDSTTDRCYCLLIENEENKPVNYLVVTTGDLGTEICAPVNFELNGFEAKVFAIGVHNSTVGFGALSAEVSAVQEID